MRLSSSSIILLTISALGTIASAQDNLKKFGICTCFKPDYDASCCILGKGYMMYKSNVCLTPDLGDSARAFEECCTGSGGRYKCKAGYRDPSHYPPENSYGCKAY